jgi:hypothetical protein
MNSNRIAESGAKVKKINGGKAPTEKEMIESMNYFEKLKMKEEMKKCQLNFKIDTAPPAKVTSIDQEIKSETEDITIYNNDNILLNDNSEINIIDVNYSINKCIDESLNKKVYDSDKCIDDPFDTTYIDSLLANDKKKAVDSNRIFLDTKNEVDKIENPELSTQAEQRLIQYNKKLDGLIEKAIINANHQDVLDALLFAVWSPKMDHWSIEHQYCDLMKDGYSSSCYIYNHNKKKWEVKAIDDIIERDGRITFISLLERYVSDIEDTLKRCDQSKKERYENYINKLNKLIGKLKNYNYTQALWKMMRKAVTKEVIYEPYHTDLATSQDLYRYNIFPGFKAIKVPMEPRDINIEMDPRLEATGLPMPTYIKHDQMDYRLRAILSHIYVVWANKDDNLYKYIMSWVSYPIRMLKKTEVAMCVTGDPGSGKSTICEFLHKHIYGEDISEIVDNFDPILQRFNGLIRGKMFISVDDQDRADNNKFLTDFQKFKPKITGTTSQIENKGKEFYKAANVNTFCVCSDQDIPIIINDKDRRYVVLKTNDIYVKNTDYFNYIYSECFNQDVGNLFYSYVRSEEFKEIVVPIIPVYMTEAKEDIINSLRPAPEKFFDEVFKEGGISIPDNLIKVKINNGKQKVYIPTPPFFTIFKDWCKDTNISCLPRADTFYKKLYKYPGIATGGRIPFDGKSISCAEIKDTDNWQNILVRIKTFDNDNHVTLDKYINDKMYLQHSNLSNPITQFSMKHTLHR